MKNVQLWIRGFRESGREDEAGPWEELTTLVLVGFLAILTLVVLF